MNWGIMFWINSVLLGFGLAMDAFSVSLVNGLSDPGMSRKRKLIISGAFGFFQFAMPLIGWVCVHTIVNLFSKFQGAIPYIALGLLLYIGSKMLFEGIHPSEGEKKMQRLGAWTLFMQAVATSIDALSVGFTIAEYGFIQALAATLIIGILTFAISLAGLNIGKRLGSKLSGKANILGGIVLIGIGWEIFLTGI
ncbi:MAG: manganese efflux pump [Ruminococcus sp.]|nr:manganese efflux pump [Ruminococcus sp.]